MKITFASSLLCCSALAAFAVEPSMTFFENDQVKVMRALEKAHVKGKAHEHKTNRVMVYLQPGQQRFEYQDGRQPKVLNWKAGQVVWSPPEGMHAPEVTGDDSFNIVEVELKKPGTGKAIDAKLDPVKVDHKHYKVELENDQVRVLRVKVGPHETIPMHEHSLNRVAIYLTDQTNRITTPDGQANTVTRKAGEVIWSTPITHKEENTAEKPFEPILVDIKE